MPAKRRRGAWLLMTLSVIVLVPAAQCYGGVSEPPHVEVEESLDDDKHLRDNTHRSRQDRLEREIEALRQRVTATNAEVAELREQVYRIRQAMRIFGTATDAMIDPIPAGTELEITETQPRSDR